MQFDQPKIQTGYIIIDKNSFAILSYYHEEYDNSFVSNRLLYNTAVPYKWKYISGSFLAIYEKVGEKYFLKNCYSKYQHLLIDNKTHSPAYVVTENFELIVNENRLNNPKTDEQKKFTLFSNLYSGQTAFNNNLNELCLKSAFHFLSPAEKNQLLSDLEKKLPVTEQFISNCK